MSPSAPPEEKVPFATRALWAAVLMPAWFAAWEGAAYLTATRTLRSAECALDARVPFIVEATVVYVVAYVQILIPVLLVTGRAEFRRTLLAFLITNVAAFAIFLAVPTVAPPVRPTPDTLPGRLLGLHYTLDTRANCCPSLHCANATLVFLATPGGPVVRTAIFILSASICASVVLVRQHWLLCIPTGIALGLAGWFLARAGAACQRPAAPVR